MTARLQRSERGTLLLRLYVAGESSNSVIARTNLRAVVARLPTDEVMLELVDVLLDPERALRDGVLVTPTLIKASPPPARRVIGNLGNRILLLAGLGLDEVHDD